MKTIKFDDFNIPVISQGVGGGSDYSDDERIKSIEYGIDLGMNFIDTAEAYEDGHSEELLGKAIQGKREDVYVATKVSPENCRYSQVLKAIDRSLKRLRTDYIDLYQIHWPNPAIPLEETLKAFEEIMASGKIKKVGLSNFSLDDFIKAQKIFDGKIFSNQVEYNISERSIESDFIPYSKNNHIPILAYNPLYLGSRSVRNILSKLSERYEKTPFQIIINFLVQNTNIIILQGARSFEHIKQNAEAIDFEFDDTDLIELKEISKTKIVEVIPSQVRVIITDSNILYTTIEEALQNKLNLEPSIQDLSENIIKEGLLKPIRLVPTTDKSGICKYNLIRGKMRFWAWVLAYGEQPIPAIINDFPYR